MQTAAPSREISADAASIERLMRASPEEVERFRAAAAQEKKAEPAKKKRDDPLRPAGRRLASLAMRALLEAEAARGGTPRPAGAPPLYRRPTDEARERSRAAEEREADRARSAAVAAAVARRKARDAAQAVTIEDLRGARPTRAEERPRPAHALVDRHPDTDAPYLFLDWKRAAHKAFANSLFIPLPVPDGQVRELMSEMAAQLDEATFATWIVDVPVFSPLLYVALSAPFRLGGKKVAMNAAPLVESSRTIALYYTAAIEILQHRAQSERQEKLEALAKAGKAPQAEDLIDVVAAMHESLRERSEDNDKQVDATLERVAADYRKRADGRSFGEGADGRFAGAEAALRDSDVVESLDTVAFAAFLATVRHLNLLESALFRLLGLPAEDRLEMSTPMLRPDAADLPAEAVAERCYANERSVCSARAASFEKAISALPPPSAEGEPELRARLLALAAASKAELADEFPASRREALDRRLPLSSDGLLPLYAYYDRFRWWTERKRAEADPPAPMTDGPSGK